MKNRIKKLSVLALSTVCLLANGATHAMDSSLLKSDLFSHPIPPQMISSYVQHLSQLLKLDEGQTIGLATSLQGDAKDVRRTFEYWIKVARKVASFELRKWESKEASYRQLQECYDFASQQLLSAQSNQTLYFSGVAKTPYTISLIQVEKETQASSLEFIRQLVESHKKMDEKKLNEYNDIKDKLSSLKKLKNQFDTFLIELSKNGKMS